EGASDYIVKPVNSEELLSVVRENLKAATEKTQPSHREFVKGAGAAARQLWTSVGLVAPTDLSVLIQGESGTGKEFVARTIHNLSKRAGKPFVSVDCGTLSNELAASELFGHVKGAFTGAIAAKAGLLEAANGGSLFLDEIGNLSYAVQVKLLRAIQEKVITPVGSNSEVRVDVRIICATNDAISES